MLRLAVSSLVALVLACAHGAAATGRQVPDSLVYVRGGDVYRMTIDGSETVRLTVTSVKESSPAVSPDRLRIAFAREPDELWTMDTQGRDQRRLVARRPQSVRYATTGSPAWAPDGRLVYFSRAAQGPNEICGWIHRVGSAGQGLRRVTRGVTLDHEPAVSPDGRRIAFSSGDCEPGLDCCYLLVVDPSGRRTKDLRNLPATAGGQFSPAWAPDGKRLAFVVEDLDTGASAVYSVNTDGSGLKRLTPRRLGGESPAWSPDGAWLAFSGAAGLYVVRPDGSGVRRLPGTKAGDDDPAWLPRT